VQGALVLGFWCAGSGFTGSQVVRGESLNTNDLWTRTSNPRTSTCAPVHPCTPWTVRIHS